MQHFPSAPSPSAFPVASARSRSPQRIPRLAACGLAILVLAACQAAGGGPDDAAAGTAPHVAVPPAPPAPSGTVGDLTLERIMADPQWIGRHPEDAYWSPDGRAIYYQRQRLDSELSDLVRIELDLSEQRIAEQRILEPAERAAAPPANVRYSEDRTRAVHDRGGDLFLLELERQPDGTLLQVSERQLTRTSARESSPQFADRDTLWFQRDGVWIERDLASGDERDALRVETGTDPDLADDEEPEGLAADEARLIRHIADGRAKRAEREAQQDELRAADASRATDPIYLGEGFEAPILELHPGGEFAMARVRAGAAPDGRRDRMPDYVTESSYVDVRDVRPHVGVRERQDNRLLWLDLVARRVLEIERALLPDIGVDRLADLREGGALEYADGARRITEHATRWSPDGGAAAVILGSQDNKDRWLLLIEGSEPRIQVLEHLVDEAWINWRFSRLTWLPDSSGFLFLSEQSGYSQVYFYERRSETVRRLTEGDFVVTDMQLSSLGDFAILRANAEHPGIFEMYRLDLPTGELTRLTELGGLTRGWLSPDDRHLLLEHSTTLEPPQLWLMPLEPGAEPKRLTRTTEPAFRELPVLMPRFVECPSRHGRPIHARVWSPPDADPEGSHPIVVFVHGAGYLQNAHRGWSSYFRETLFHSLLAYRGAVVLDLDYRGSAGYGRDWRTAVYRRMGTPELEDVEDTIDFAAEHFGGDPERVGIYGGSYGGFLTLMALFTRADRFACGAALRPVTDWRHYNDGYTRNILNRPAEDPEAFRVSSPIEFAEGLEDPLLICHGLVDDNVLAKDSIRLAQRLIELEKQDWELMLYPVEPHGFREPSSWLDEYRRILKLFEEHLGLAPEGGAPPPLPPCVVF